MGLFSIKDIDDALNKQKEKKKIKKKDNNENNNINTSTIIEKEKISTIKKNINPVVDKKDSLNITTKTNKENEENMKKIQDEEKNKKSTNNERKIENNKKEVKTTDNDVIQEIIVKKPTVEYISLTKFNKVCEHYDKELQTLKEKCNKQSEAITEVLQMLRNCIQSFDDMVHGKKCTNTSCKQLLQTYRKLLEN